MLAHHWDGTPGIFIRHSTRRAVRSFGGTGLSSGSVRSRTRKRRPPDNWSKKASARRPAKRRGRCSPRQQAPRAQPPDNWSTGGGPPSAEAGVGAPNFQFLNHSAQIIMHCDRLDMLRLNQVDSIWPRSAGPPAVATLHLSNHHVKQTLPTQLCMRAQTELRSQHT